MRKLSVEGSSYGHMHSGFSAEVEQVGVTYLRLMSSSEVCLRTAILLTWLP